MKYSIWKFDKTEFRVRLYPNRKQFLAYSRSIESNGKRFSGKGKAAYFMKFFYDPETFYELVFYEQYFTIDDISHEVGHMLIEHFRQKDLLTEDEKEEAFCIYLGKIVSLIMDWKNKVI